MIKIKMMRIKNVIILIFLALLTVETTIIVKQDLQIKYLKKKIPVLIEGEKLKYFDLVDAETRIIDNKILEKYPYSILFIFENPCSPCNDNIVYWKKIKKFINNKIPIYGIIPDYYEKMVDFSNTGGMNFSVYAPVNKNKFINELKLKFNFAETLLLKRNKIEYIRIGKIDNDEFTGLLLKIKKIIKNKEGK